MKPIGHRQYDLLLDMHVREKTGDPVVWFDMTNLNRRRTVGLLDRGLVVSKILQGYGRVFLTDAGRAVLEVGR